MKPSDIHKNRDYNKINLQTWTMDLKNVFDSPVDKLIEDIKKKCIAVQNEHDEWTRLEENENERYKAIEEQAEHYEINLLQQRYDYILDLIYYQEQMQAILEMKVIYSFKSLEINLKKLLATAFKLNNVKEFYRWEYVIRFLANNNIDVKKVMYFKEIDELRLVNNFLKHSHSFDQSLKIIQEFSSVNEIRLLELEQFYNRISFAPQRFLEGLSISIYQELYEFNDQKLMSIATELALRLETKDALKLKDTIEYIFSENGALNSSTNH